MCFHPLLFVTTQRDRALLSQLQHPLGEVQGLERKSSSLKKSQNLRETSRKEKTGEITFLKLVKIQNSEVNPEDEQQDCICSGFKSEEQMLCDKPSKDFYGTVKKYSAKNMIHSTLCIMFFVKFTFLQRSYFCPSV